MSFASHRLTALTFGLIVVGAIAACSDDDDPIAPAPIPDAGPADTGAPQPDAGPAPDAGCTTVLSFAPGQEAQLQDAVNDLTGCADITLAAGTFTFDNAITIRQAGVSIHGAGKGAKGEAAGGAASTVLVFTTAAANTNGIDVVGDDFAIRDLAIWNAKKDALRVESSKRVKIQKVRTEWATENAAANGAYGVYPVKSEDVLVEDCEAYNASDAGIYVGQTKRTIVRRNVAKQNVAGIEIENTQNADVYENTAEDNTCGLVVFDLPGNVTAGTDIRVHANTIVNNNRNNFAGTGGSSSTVSQVPAGTGTFILASRRVELFGNTWTNNNSTDIAVLSGLTLVADPAQWAAGGFNFNSKDIYIHDNTFNAGSGDSVDNGTPDPVTRRLGAIIAGMYQYGTTIDAVERVEPVIWDGVDPMGATGATANDINLCVKTNTFPVGTAFAVADLDFPDSVPLMTGTVPDVPGAWDETTRAAADAAPYDCAGFTPALTPVVLP